MAEYSAWRGAGTGTVLWRVRADADHRVLPDGALDLMWFEDRPVVAGPDTRPMTVNVEPGARTFGLRFPPGTAASLLRVSAAELVNQRVALRDLVAASALPALRSAGGQERETPVALLERMFVELWQRSDPAPEKLRLAALLERRARQGASVSSVACETGLSERSLRRTSRVLFGYGLKTLSGIRRFQRASDLLRAGVGLSEAAARAGYADQPHMTREIVRFADMTPARLLRAGEATAGTVATGRATAGSTTSGA